MSLVNQSGNSYASTGRESRRTDDEARLILAPNRRCCVLSHSGAAPIPAIIAEAVVAAEEAAECMLPPTAAPATIGFRGGEGDGDDDKRLPRGDGRDASDARDARDAADRMEGLGDGAGEAEGREGLARGLAMVRRDGAEGGTDNMGRGQGRRPPPPTPPPPTPPPPLPWRTAVLGPSVVGVGEAEPLPTGAGLALSLAACVAAGSDGEAGDS